MKPALKRVRLRWTGDGMVFRGGPLSPSENGGPGVSIAPPETVVDGDSVAGPSPMDHLLLGLAGCMAVDVRMILEKSRVPLEAMEIEVEGERAPDPPRRYVRVRLVYRLQGPGPEDEAKVQRAVDLSRDKYCSVLHSLRPDLDLSIEVHRL